MTEPAKRARKNPRIVSCPECGVKSGDQCVDVDGTPFNKYHRGRIALSDKEMTKAVEKLSQAMTDAGILR